MSIGIYSALSGIKIKEEELDLVAHNLANSSTNGYKEENVAFEAVLGTYQNGGADASATPFSVVGKRSYNFQPGPIVTTNNSFDLAIQGDGFFEIQTEKGTFYTRDGAFSTDSTGKLVNQKGDLVVGSTGAIQVGTDGNVQISPSGTVTVNGEQKGSVKIVNFADPQKLQAAGGNYFRASGDAAPTNAANPSVLQGKLEQSNTNVMLSLVKLVEISKQYQTYQKMISNQTRLESESATSLGKVS